MDVLINKLKNFGFVRCGGQIGKVCVVHCVPGAGKSTLIRQLILEDSRFKAVTFGLPDPKNLSGRYIKAASEVDLPSAGNLVLVDEYTEGCDFPIGTIAIFGDPLQSQVAGLQANFIANTTRRFGESTCKLLRSFGFEIYSEKEDSCVVAGFFDVEPVGTVIAFEEEVKDILRAHRVDFEDVCSIRGKTFEAVTFFTAQQNIPDSQRHLFYQCLTRHTRSIVIACPDASFSPA